MGGSGVVIVRYEIASSETDAQATMPATGGHISFHNDKTIHTFVTPGTFATTPGFSETCEYVIIGGGGSGGNGYSGAGGAGGYATNTTPIGGGLSLSVTVGDGGKAANRCNPSGADAHGRGMQGRPSQVNFPAGTINCDGGGYGQTNDVPPNSAGGPGGSGGGGGVGPGGSGSMSNPGPGNGDGGGNPGGSGNQAFSAGANGGGGGGGAGAAPAGNGGGAGSSGGYGGWGVQIPTTFQDPKSTVGYNGNVPGSIWYWVAAGGGGGCSDAKGYGGAKGGSPPYAPLAGAGDGADPGNMYISGNGERHGRANSGSGGGGTGGGGQDGSGAATNPSGQGGSGLVLIAYPT